ncbi:MAG: thiol-disulfide oxidoreductase DCC family protein [Flavobacteriales bacterium]|nr:thiol-disulfide oxidoreductase DCC family protein [Flavobacteriales bacterium]
MERIVLFDGVCDLCNGFVQFIIERDPKARFHFGTLQSAEAKSFLEGGTIDPRDPDTVIYRRKGRLLTRSSAALNVLRDLSGAWPLMYAFIIVPPFLRDAVYRWVAKNRYKWFGKRDSCMIPTPDMRSRFLDGPRG